MDFVDLDRVLDEFEEEEKAALSIVPGEELKPSGYIQFLEKHENQEWASVNTDTTNHNFNIGTNYVKDSINVSYDEPYNYYPSSKLDFIQDKSLSPGISKVDQLVITGERAWGLKDHVENRSKRGTIASKTTEVQTDALSPTTELELSSLPYPKSDIIVEGHENGQDEVTNLTKNNLDQNNSPIYASMDSSRLFSSLSDNLSVMSSNTSVQSNFIGETQQTLSQYAQANYNHPVSPSKTVSGSVISFQDVDNRDLDEHEINMYLNEIEREEQTENIDIKSGSDCNLVQNSSADHQLNISFNDEDLRLNHSGNSIHLSTEKQGHSNDIGTIKMEIDSSGSVCKDKDISELLQQDQHRVYNSLIHDNIEIHDILEEKKGKYITTERLPSDIQKKGDNSIYEQLMFDRMEVEDLINEVVEKKHNKMEIEGLIEEVVENQQNKKSNGNRNDISLYTAFSKSGEVVEDGISQKLSTRVGLQNGIHTKEKKFSSENDMKLPMSNDGGDMIVFTGIGARPKDPSILRKNRPSSLHGLSKVSLDQPSPSKNLENDIVLPHNKNPNELVSQQMMTDSPVCRIQEHPDFGMSKTVNEAKQRMNSEDDKPVVASSVSPIYDSYNEADEDDNQLTSCQGGHEGSLNVADGVKKMSRPTTLNLPSRPEFDLTGQSDGEMENAIQNRSQVTQSEGEETAALACNNATDDVPQPEDVSEASGPLPLRNLGEVAPFWVPDTEAESCMTCGVKFTLWKRRHHCRACGKVLCSQCCSQKSFLRYMESEARVCVECYLDLNVAQTAEASPRSPNPNNPSEYCSKVPPNQQASNHGSPPTVMVPTGVLKSSGSNRRGGEPKQVMFSDGIRPGGDLTELDGGDQNRSHRRSARAARKAQQQTQNAAKKLKNDSLSRSPCLVPVNGLPPLYILEGEKGHVELDEALNQLDYSDDYRMEGGPSIYYSVNKNLAVAVKVVNLDCCMNRVCWSFVSRGMSSVGQRELVILLELTEEEANSQSIQPPRDIFLHYHFLYEEALKGFTIQDMGHTILHQSFLGSRDHGGFLYVQSTFQCLNKLTLPEAPFAFGILLQKWEAPWAKVFPIRLVLRLGAEFRYYPCPLISVRNRKPVFYEIGHTIMNLLADFRNFQYSLSQIRGVTIHMEDKKTVINLPHNRYNDIMKVVRSSNEHVMAFGSSFSSVADSHLVCIQNEEGNYQTQAINIQNKPRQVTGASFVVFNGALKASSGLRAKSSIVEDGVMVQVLPEAMATLKQALKNMTNHTIPCGPVDASEPDEVLEIKWVDNDKSFNIGVKSYIDGMSLEGMDSVSVKSTSDFVGKELAIRWTRVYFLRQDNPQQSHFDPVDLTRLTEEIAQACCTAMVPHLEELRDLEQIKIGLRVNLTQDFVGYEIGSKGQGLSGKILTSLDTYLIPIIHQASEEGMVLELVFHILD